MKQKKALFFGSFNPIHIAHLCIAQYVLNYEGFDKVSFVLSPQNPHKAIPGLLPPELRLNLLQKSILSNPGFEVEEIEFHLPLPSYTTHTLEALHEREPDTEFALIMGTDTLAGLPFWKNPDSILQHSILVYPRSGDFQIPFPENPHIRFMDSPLLDISSTRIREMLKGNKSVRYMVSDAIVDELQSLDFSKLS